MVKCGQPSHKPKTKMRAAPFMWVIIGPGFRFSPKEVVYTGLGAPHPQLVVEAPRACIKS